MANKIVSYVFISLSFTKPVFSQFFIWCKKIVMHGICHATKLLLLIYLSKTKY